VIEVTPVRTTVTVVDPEHAEHEPDDAVMSDDPTATAVTMPEVCPTVTELCVADDHVTPDVSAFWLPSLYVPVALICQVSFTFRVRL
jgi:hypothetical protein